MSRSDLLFPRYGHTICNVIVLTMPSQQDKPKRWRPRFSVKTLVVIVTLVCCYAACWGPTKSWGVNDALTKGEATRANSIVHDTYPVIPLVICVDWTCGPPMQPKLGERRDYFFWFFGYVAKFYERDV
jgi:hypothetical protein